MFSLGFDPLVQPLTSTHRDEPVDFAAMFGQETMIHRVGRNNTKKDFTPEILLYLKRFLLQKINGDPKFPIPVITDQEKAQIIAATGLKLVQVSGWFYNRRKDQRYGHLPQYLADVTLD